MGAPDWRCMDPIENGDIPASYLSLPEGIMTQVFGPSAFPNLKIFSKSKDLGLQPSEQQNSHQQNSRWR